MRGAVEAGRLLSFLREYALDYIAAFQESYIRRLEKLKRWLSALSFQTSAQHILRRARNNLLHGGKHRR